MDEMGKAREAKVSLRVVLGVEVGRCGREVGEALCCADGDSEWATAVATVVSVVSVEGVSGCSGSVSVAGVTGKLQWCQWCSGCSAVERVLVTVGNDSVALAVGPSLGFCRTQIGEEGPAGTVGVLMEMVTCG